MIATKKEKFNDQQLEIIEIMRDKRKHETIL